MLELRRSQGDYFFYIFIHETPLDLPHWQEYQTTQIILGQHSIATNRNSESDNTLKCMLSIIPIQYAPAQVQKHIKVKSQVKCQACSCISSLHISNFISLSIKALSFKSPINRSIKLVLVFHRTTKHCHFYDWFILLAFCVTDISPFL